ncbi:MAG: hypothetical protein H7X77_07735, partial [Anaerolineae bacterium]|nr:hypothetical protein [Anaerolineae bacterium]
MSEYDRPIENSRAADCEVLDELLPAFAFGLLDETEKRQVEKLLPNCPDRAGELADYQAMATRMLHSATPIEPAPDLLLRLLQATAPATTTNRTHNNIASALPIKRQRQLPRVKPGILAGIAAAF